MKWCMTCKRFDRATKTLGICTDTGEAVGEKNNCIDWDGEINEEMIREVVKLYFENCTVEEAIEKVREMYWIGGDNDVD